MDEFEKALTKEQLELLESIKPDFRDMDTGEHISRTSYIVKALSLNAKGDGVYSDIIDDTDFEV